MIIKPEPIDSLLKSKNEKEKIASMMKNFFAFYVKYDFEQKVVCPYLGRSVDKSVFGELDNLEKDENALDSLSDDLKEMSFYKYINRVLMQKESV